MNGFPLPKGQREAIHHEGEKKKTVENKHIASVTLNGKTGTKKITVSQKDVRVCIIASR